MYAWGLLRKIHHMPCLHCKKKKKNRMHVLQICCFNRHSNLQCRMNCGPDGAGVTPHHIAPMPRWSDRRQHFGHRLISRKLTLRCGVVASLARPIPIGIFPSGYVKAKAYTCPWATKSYRIRCYRQGIAEISTDQCRRTVDHYRHFRFLSFFTHFFKAPPKAGKVSRFSWNLHQTLLPTLR